MASGDKGEMKNIVVYNDLCQIGGVEWILTIFIAYKDVVNNFLKAL